ncbi:hypothetical protein ABPG72_007447 [Tetrahymena utriculariae]
MSYLKLLKITWNNPWTLNPNVYVPRIDQIDYSKLKELGIKYLVFDKDNTLTAHLKNEFYDNKIQSCVRNEIKQTYDENSQIYIVSNSIKTEQKQNEVQQNLGIQLILTNQKKPHNFQEIINHIKQKNAKVLVKNHEIAFFGDRLFTDVLLANLNGAVSIYTDPFNNQNEHLGIWLFRKIEKQIFSKFQNSRSINLYYLNQNIQNFDKVVIKQSQQQ